MDTQTVTLVGTTGSDTLIGSAFDDLLLGLAGRDRLLGGGGADTLIGGAGDDRLSGGAGDDILFGGAGRNILHGGRGADRFVLEARDLALVGDFDAEQGDRIVVAIPELLDALGAPDASLLQVRDNGGDLLLRGLLDGSVVTLANIRGAAGLALDDVLLRPVADIPANTRTSATLDFGAARFSEIGSEDDRDWYRVELRGGFDYIFTLEGDPSDDAPLEDPFFRLYDATGRLIGFNDDGFPGRDSFFLFRSLADQTVFAAASADPRGLGDYRLLVEEDIANGSATAAHLEVGREVVSTIDYRGDADTFAVELEGGFVYLFTMTAETEVGQPLLWEELGVSDPSSGAGQSGVGGTVLGGSVLAFDVATDRTVFATAWGSEFGSAVGAYRLSVEVLAAQPLPLAELDGANGFTLIGARADDNIGLSVSGAGDVNGDGLDDLIVGAPGSYFFPDRSGAFVVFGTADGFPAEVPLADLDGRNGFVVNGIDAEDRAGASVGSAGDINGDGVDDIVIGAPYADPNGYGSGESYVVFGRRDGFEPSLDLVDLDGSDGFVLKGISNLERSGQSVGAAGDVNGDGFDDLVIGAPLARSSETDPSGLSGRTYVLFGGETGFDAEVDLEALDGRDGFVINGFGEAGYAGFSVARAGDVNGDGIDDIVIGAPVTNANGLRSGASYVVFGRADGFAAALGLDAIDGQNGFVIRGAAAGDSSGRVVSSAGDFDGDGLDDLLIGAPFTDLDGRTSFGSAYVVFGEDMGFPAVIELRDLNGANGFELTGVDFRTIFFGRSVNYAGDVNGDGFDDILNGSDTREYYDYGGDETGSEGQAYVVFGRERDGSARLDLGDLDASTGFTFAGVDDFDEAGFAVNGAGDINGDGFDDMIIGGGSRERSTGVDEAYVVFGAADIGANFALTEAALPTALDAPLDDGTGVFVA